MKQVWRIAAAVLCVLLAACGIDGVPVEETTEEYYPLMELIGESGGDYVVVHNKSNANRGYAYDFMWAIKNETKHDLKVVRDQDTPESAAELLIGPTNRQLSLDLQAELEAKYPADSSYWGFAYRDGQFAFYYNTETAFHKGILHMKDLLLKDGTFYAPAEEWVTAEFSAAESAAIEAEKAAEALR